MKLKAEWDAIRRRIGTALHAVNLRDAADQRDPVPDNREWVVIYRTAHGYCCMYRGSPVTFEDRLDVDMWADDMDLRPYFIGL